jgi:hypothetical protein
VPVRLPDTYETVTEYMILLVLLIITRTTEIGATQKDAKEPNQVYELLGQSDVCLCTCHSSLSVAVDTP